MKIGLIRHFKVKHAYPKNMLISLDEVLHWFAGYESAEIQSTHVDLRGIEFKRCYTSSAERALGTAGIIFKGEKTILHELRELDVLPLMNNKRKLPFLMWAILVRIKASSSNRITDEFKNNISAFLDELLLKNTDDVLIVSHGFVMMYMQKELKRRGFKGIGFRAPENGKLYVFEKEDFL
jgi:broad specificity phosphatase PhoE